MTVDASNGRVCHDRLSSGETGGQTLRGPCTLTRLPGPPPKDQKTLAELPNLDFCQTRSFRPSSLRGVRQTKQNRYCTYDTTATTVTVHALTGQASSSCCNQPPGHHCHSLLSPPPSPEPDDDYHYHDHYHHYRTTTTSHQLLLTSSSHPSSHTIVVRHPDHRSTQDSW